MFEYPIKIVKDTNGTFLVTFPDIPEAITFGDTKAEAYQKACEALEVALSMYIDDGRALPAPSGRKTQLCAYPSLKGMMKLAIYQAMRDQKIRKVDLARRLGWSGMQVDRILDLTHSSRIEQLGEAILALGKRFRMETEKLRAA